MFTRWMKDIFVDNKKKCELYKVLSKWLPLTQKSQKSQLEILCIYIGLSMERSVLSKFGLESQYKMPCVILVGHQVWVLLRESYDCTQK